MSADRRPIGRNDVLLALGVVAAHGAAVLVLLSLGDTVLTGAARAALPVTTFLLVAEGLSLVLWRSRPLVCQALVWLLGVAMVLVPPEGYSVTGFGQLVASLGIGLRVPLRRAVPLLSVLALAHGVLAAWREVLLWPLGAVRILNSLIVFLVPLLGGAVLASRGRHERFRRELLRREHEHHLEMAVLQERRRLARELHDVAAHHLAGIVVQAAAVERLVDRDPGTARASAAQLRGQAKEALAGLRSVVGLLRGDDEDGAAVPGLDALASLVASVRELGVDIELRAQEQNSRPRLPRQADLAAYRVVQQAVSNALQHAPGARVLVQAQRVGATLVLSVTNSAPLRTPSTAAGGGTGLLVMRERADAVGGVLEAGPTQDGGWRVRLVLPLDQEEDA